jgi:hypothetical protein
MGIIIKVLKSEDSLNLEASPKANFERYAGGPRSYLAGTPSHSASQNQQGSSKFLSPRPISRKTSPKATFEGCAGSLRSYLAGTPTHPKTSKEALRPEA